MVVFGGVVTCATAIAAIGAIHARLYGHDIFFLLDNGWRALQGQRVHVDYSSAWEPLTFLLMAAGLAISGGSPAAPSYAVAIATLVSGLWAAWLAVARSRTLTAPVFAWCVTLLAGAPFAVGDSPSLTSHGMVYNRWGYALLSVLMLEGFLRPTQPGKARRILEPLLSGCAVGLALSLKITYFMVAAPLAVFSLWMRPERGRRALWCAAGFGVTALLLLVYLRFGVGAMIDDLVMAASGRSASLAWRHSPGEIAVGALGKLIPLAMLAAACVWLNRQRESGGEWRWNHLVMALVAVAGADAALLMTNAQVLCYPLMAVFTLLVLFLIEPELRGSEQHEHAKTAPALLAAGLLLAMPVNLDNFLGLGFALQERIANPEPDGVLRFDSPRLRPLVLYDASPTDPDRFSDGRLYVGSINDGMRLLEAHTHPSDKVATLDMFNPFAYALERAPIRGGMAAAQFNYFFSQRLHLSPERFFGDAAVVMVPKFPATREFFYAGYRALYLPEVQKRFHLAAESEHWWMYRRNEPVAEQR